MSSPQRQMRRRAEQARRRAAKVPPSRLFRCYHGTIAAAAASIRRGGLTARDGITPFVTIDPDRAAGYAMRAICHDLHQRGLDDQPEEAQQACIVELHVDRDALVPDPSCEGDYALTRCPPAWVHELHVADLSDQVPPPDEVADYAELMVTARKLEGGYQAQRLRLSGSTSEDRLANAVIAASTCPDSERHGGDHWFKVARAGLMLLDDGCEADAAVLWAFALLHDSQHRGGRDPEHGRRAADLARRLNSEGELRLDGPRLELLCDALTRHDDRLTTDDATLGACWDADRLARFAPAPASLRVELLSTVQGRRIAAGGQLSSLRSPVDGSWLARRYGLHARGEPVPDLDDDWAGVHVDLD